jgi:ATP-dependent DNA helicase RecG
MFDLVERAEFYILNNTRRRLIIKEDKPREDVPEIPRKAVHEALMNAYAHRDWHSNEAVVVDIYYDTVEITSPGWFIEGQNPEDHLSGKSASSVSRNNLIVKTLFRSGDIEAYGSGIPRIKELCDAAGVQVRYEQVPNGTKLIFVRNDAFEEGEVVQLDRSTPQDESVTPQDTPQEDCSTPQDTPQDEVLTPQDEAIIEAIGLGELSMQSLAEKLNLSDRKNLKKLYVDPAINKGLVEMTNPDKPTSKNQRYRLTVKAKRYIS